MKWFKKKIKRSKDILDMTYLCWTCSGLRLKSQVLFMENKKPNQDCQNCGNKIEDFSELLPTVIKKVFGEGVK